MTWLCVVDTQSVEKLIFLDDAHERKFIKKQNIASIPVIVGKIYDLTVDNINFTFTSVALSGKSIWSIGHNNISGQHHSGP